VNPLDTVASWPTRMRTGLLVIGVLAVAAVLGPLLAGDPTAIVDPQAAALLPPGARRVVLTRRDGSTVAAETAHRVGNSWDITRLGAHQTIPAGDVEEVSSRRFWLGTDTVGRDVLARLLSGARVSLAIGALALTVALVIGVGTGLASGWIGGFTDAILMRIVDALLAIPMLFLLLFLAAVFRPSLIALVVVLGLSSWMGVARLTRGQVLSLRERDFIVAERALGASGWRIAFCHLLPNAVTPIAQDGALRLGDLILMEASLSFLGLGVQPPVASWGNMVAEGQQVLANAWWLTFLPAALVALTVIGAALLADGLQELARRDTVPG
jgi:peptide/nickel transport system permease protein